MSSKLSFYRVGDRGTVRSTPNYNPEAACEKLYLSMKGLGTDEELLTNVICEHTFHQRQELKQVYRQKYGKELVREIDSELSFSFAKTVLALMAQPEVYILECIHQAISKSQAARLLKQLQKIYKKGSLDSTEYNLLSLLCPRSNNDLESIKAMYKLKYDTELEDDIGSDLSEELRSLILDMVSGGREEEDPDIGIDPEKVREDANNLYAASFVPEGELCGTKERVFQQIVNTRSYEHLRQLFPVYKELADKTIEQYVENTHLVPELKQAYLAILKILQNEPEFYAARLREAIAGLGTDDDSLISIVVLRSEIDMLDILVAYEKMFGVTLQEDVKGDTSGDYENILLTLLKSPEEKVEKEEEKHTTEVESTEQVEQSELAITTTEAVEPLVEETPVPLAEPKETLDEKEVDVPKSEVIIIVDTVEEEPREEEEEEIIPPEQPEHEEVKEVDQVPLSQAENGDTTTVELDGMPKDEVEVVPIAKDEIQMEEPITKQETEEERITENPETNNNNNEVKSGENVEDTAGEEVGVIGG